jgi:tetratricopeptide (TPR) repeat protein
LLGFLAAAGLGVVRAVRRLEGIEQAAAVALSVLAAAYLLHSLVDFDWDFVAVSGPFFLTVGLLSGGRMARDEPRPWLAPLPVVVAVAMALSLLTPWFAQRATDAAQRALADARPLQAYRDARDARSLNPLALDPIFAQALALDQLGDFQGERQLYIDAVRLQPLNWRAWFVLGEFEKSQQDYARAIPPLRRAVELDPQGSLAQAELEAVKKLAP